MARRPQRRTSRLNFSISTDQRPDFKGGLVAHVFDTSGKLLEQTAVKNGKVELKTAKAGAFMPRIVIAPEIEGDDYSKDNVTIERLLNLGAYEPALRQNGKLIENIVIPGPVLDLWPFCFCWVRGRVIRASDSLPVCNARVHICEVDRLPRWILQLPDRDVLRLRDDLLDIIKNPPIPEPVPDFPEIIPDLPDPVPPIPFNRSRFTERLNIRGFNPQPEPPALARPEMLRFDARALTPQLAARAPIQPAEINISSELRASLLSNSVDNVRFALSENWRLIIPWLCLWPHWWSRFRCDEIATVETDAHGNFERLIIYPCNGDRPDLYFWVEYDLGSGFETVYRPHIGCNTYWNYDCGTEVTIRISDERVPACDPETPLQGLQVVVKSIGREISVREVDGDGLVNGTAPLGSALEPRVDFGREALIAADIPYYRWSYRRLTGTNGSISNVGPWTPMTRSVYRHYRDGTSFPSQAMGPLPTVGSSPAPAENLFLIKPLDPPSGEEWVVLNERVDLATAYFDTHTLPGSPSAANGFAEDMAAGLYEIKLELFDDAGNRVEDWDARNIDLRIINADAPFGTGTVETIPAPSSNRLSDGSPIDGFRMVVRVDNNRCSAEIDPIGGTVTADPDCGFHTYDSGDTAGLIFNARHPNDFATYSFNTGRGDGPALSLASTSGVVGEAGNDGFGEISDSRYSKNVGVSLLLGSCPNAAFWERLSVRAMATNGYSRLSGYDAADNAAFSLAQPCPECECEEEG